MTLAFTCNTMPDVSFCMTYACVLDCRPRSKLDADRVVYCGIERCFFEVTVVQGWFRYRISKRLVTTDSSRDQPPCPPNLGETMDSIRSQMLAPQRMLSPPLLGPNAPQISTPLSPGKPAVPVLPSPLLDSPQEHVAAQDWVVAQESVAEQSADAAQAVKAHQHRVADGRTEACPDEAQTVEPRSQNNLCTTRTQSLSDRCQSTTLQTTVRSGRVSVDGVSSGSISARRPGLLTQEFNRV